MIVEEGHIALNGGADGMEELELRQKGKKLDAAGPLYVALTEYKKLDLATPSPLSVVTPGDKRCRREKIQRCTRERKG